MWSVETFIGKANASPEWRDWAREERLEEDAGQENFQQIFDIGIVNKQTLHINYVINRRIPGVNEFEGMRSETIPAGQEPG